MVASAVFEYALCLLVGYVLISSLIRLGLIRKISNKVLEARALYDGPFAQTDSQSNSQTTFPVKYVSEKHSNSLFRLVPWDASGTLRTTDEGIHFSGASPLGNKIEMSFHPDDTRVNYQRGKLLWDGGVPWCVIEVDGEKHYFTSDMSELPDFAATEKPLTTTHIYQNLTKRYVEN